MVTDEKGEPIPFANIIVKSLPDSTFINGTSSGVNGRFSLDRKQNGRQIIKISYLGYKTFTKENFGNNLGNIQLLPDSKVLKEVVVTGNRPTHKMESDGIVTNVQNTLLAKLGTANDVIGQLPFVKGQDGNFSVFGRGTPLIYLNNRQIRNNDELKQLKSSDIKDVKVILSPGAQYDASVGSVIYITTLKPVGEGLSGQLYGQIYQRRLFTHYESANLNYRKNKWDIFGYLSYIKMRFTQNQEDESLLFLDKIYSTKTKNKQENNLYTWNGNAGINYSFSPTHMIEFRYNYYNMPNSRFFIPSELHHFIDDTEDALLKGNDNIKMEVKRHYINLYYHKEFNNNTLFYVEGDIVSGIQNNYQSNDFTDVENNKKTFVENQNNSTYSLYAVKTFVEAPLLGGKITIGNDLLILTIIRITKCIIKI